MWRYQGIHEAETSHIRENSVAVTGLGSDWRTPLNFARHGRSSPTPINTHVRGGAEFPPPTSAANGDR